jgi:pyrroloquinoline quinone (PQQ) biosynthesis protein C
MTATLASLDDMLRESQAYENRFFQISRNNQVKWDKRHLNVFGPEYYHFTRKFPEILCGLAHRDLGEKIRHWLVTILYSEMGRENYDAAHSKLFEKLLLSAGLRDFEINRENHFEETDKLVNQLKVIYLNAPLPFALGAQYMLEAQADNMLKQFYCAFVRLVDNNFANDKPDFFTIHETDELQHQIAMRDCLNCNMARENWNDVSDGARECLTLFSDFWNRLEGEVTRINSHSNQLLP